jgi:hypothetical protein
MQELQILDVSALEAQTKAEIDIQIATAKKYPRDIARTQNNVLALATVDQATAQGCFYSLKRGENKIEGPSVRLAEIVASSWSNIRYGARVISDDGKQLTAQGFCLDLEVNNAVQIEVKARVTDKTGKRYSDDMIVMAGNAACAKALRNAIFKVVPMGAFNSIMSEIKKKASGVNTDIPLEKRAENAVKYFVKLGVSEERIFNTIGKKAISEMDEEDLTLLIGLKTSIADKEITLTEAFPETKKEESESRSSKAAESVADKLKDK